jgi:cobalt-zinc-cadmium efflux system membrane fusion protein
MGEAARSRRSLVRAAWAALLLALAGPGWAHEGHDHGAAAVPAIPPDAVPRRQPDGSVFLPRATQQLLDIRTIETRRGEAQATVEVAGRVIPDPNASGRVQATQAGRLEPGARGFPFLGQTVQPGDELLTLVPAPSTIELANLRKEIARIDKEATSLQPQLQHLGDAIPTMPMADMNFALMQDLQIQAQGLQQQREALAGALDRKEPLRAPVGGVVVQVNAVAGQVAEPRDILVEIVDPTRLWVEAFAFDPSPLEGVATVAAASGRGTSLSLAFQGRGRQLRQQAVPLIFRIEAPPAGLDVGESVRVFLPSGEARTAIVVPKAALQRDAGGLPMLWEQVEDERFAPRLVRTRPFDGAAVLVEAGIEPGRRIVAEGAVFLSGIR